MTASVVQESATEATTTNTVNVTLNGVLGGLGSVIHVVGMQNNYVSIPTLTLTDGASRSYLPILGMSRNAPSIWVIQQWYYPNITAGSVTITMNSTSSATYTNIWAREIAGASSVLPSGNNSGILADTNASDAAPGSGTDAITTSMALTSSTPTNILVSGVVCLPSFGNEAPAAGTNYILGSTFWNSNSGSSEYRRFAGSTNGTNVNATWTAFGGTGSSTFMYAAAGFLETTGIAKRIWIMP
jgi:hypothetical protein